MLTYIDKLRAAPLENHMRYARVCQWAQRRYPMKAHTDGTHTGSPQMRYLDIQAAAWDKYIEPTGARHG